VQIDKNAGNYEVAEADDANNIIQKKIPISMMLKPTREILPQIPLHLSFLLRTTRPTSLMPVQSPLFPLRPMRLTIKE
jgi:hypothetical protein